MHKDRKHELILQTQEGVHFSLPLASPITRCFALALDLMVIVGLMSLVGTVASVLQLLSPDIITGLAMLAYFIISIGYFMFTEWAWRGQTIGKRVLRIRVMDAQALKLQPSQIILRNLLRFVDSLPMLYVIGGIASLLNKHSQRLGDLAAGTVVVRMPKHKIPHFPDVLEGKYNSFRQYPHLEALLRQRCDPEETDIAMQAVLRRDEMDAIPRAQLFKELAEHFSEAVRFPEEAILGLSDEQYIRNCVDSLYRKKKL